MKHPLQYALLAVLLALPVTLRAQVVVNEVMYTPNSPEPEWIELFNPTQLPVDLTGWTIQDRTSSRPSIPAATILPQGFLLLTRDSTALRSVRSFQSPVVQISIPALNNGGDDVILRDADGKTIDSLSYASSWGGTGGLSLERIEEGSATNNPDSWGSSVDGSGGTPGRRNSLAPAEFDLQILTAQFDPDRKEAKVVIVNLGKEASFLSTAALYYDANNDSIGTPNEQQSGRSIPSIEPGDSSTVFLSWNRVLTVMGEQGLVVVDNPNEERPTDNSRLILIREKFVDTGVIVNEVMYTPGNAEPEWVELFNRGIFPVDLQNWILHDRSSARPRLPSSTLLPGAYVVVAGDTSALRKLYDIPSQVIEVDLPAFNNSGDDIVLRNPFGRAVDSLHYFGSWGGETGRSLERRLPTLVSDDPLSWETSIDPSGGTPGRENSTRPPKYDLILTGLEVDESGKMIRVEIQNNGTAEARGAEALLFFDSDNDTLADPGEEQSRQSIPQLSSGDFTTVTFAWTRPLQLQGEQGIVLLQLPNEERPDDNVGSIILRQPTVDTGLIINEIMYTPLDPEPEWIEVYNRGLLPVEMRGWRVEDGTGRSPLLPTLIILPGSYAILTNDTTELLRLRTVSSNLVQSPLPAFNNSGDLVLLRNGRGVAVDSLRYRSTWGGKNGKSLERKGVDLPTNDSTSWSEATAASGATPGGKNSYQPLLHDLAVGVVLFNPNTSTLSGHIRNYGLEGSTPASLHLYFDFNSNRVADEEEELEVSQLPSIPPGDSLPFTLTWSRELTPLGEQGIVLVELPEDQRSTNDTTFFTAASPRVDTGVVINEIMYAPNDPEPEWVELVNRGELPVDLEGWSLHDGSSARPKLPRQLLLPNEYIVVASDTSSMRALYPQIGTIVGIDLPTLNNSGDDVVLRNASGKVIDSLHYRASWGGDSGRSVERRLPTLPSDSSSSWNTSTALEGGTPGEENSVAIADLDLRLATLQFDIERSEVQATLYNIGRAESNRAEGILYHDRNGDNVGEASEELRRVEIPPISPNDSTTFTIAWPRPLLPEGERGIVQITMPGEVRVEDNSLSFSPRSRTGTSKIILNEVMYAPHSPEPEWLEVYNTDTLPVDLTNWRIGDASGSKTIPPIIVPPGTYLLLTTDSAALQASRLLDDTVHILTLPLPTFNNGEDEILLHNSSGDLVDSLHYLASWGGANGKSLERRHFTNQTNDSASWQTSEDSAGATPGRANSIFPPLYNLGIDSIAFDPSTTLLSVYLYNNGINRTEEGSLKLFHDANRNGFGEVEEELATTAISSIEAGETALITFGWERELRDEGEIALLHILLPSDQRGRDNSASIELRREPLDSGLVVSEIMFDPLPVAGESGAEYIEVFSRATRPIPLRGWSITEGSGTVRFVADSTFTISPQSYCVIATDSSIYRRYPSLLDSSNVIILGKELGLNQSGDVVLLRNPSGRTIDSVNYSEEWHWREIGDVRGVALERIDLAGASNDPRNWSSSVAPSGGTPGEQNSRSIQPATEVTELTVEPRTISPDGDGFEDFTRISYHFPAPGSLITISIYDRRGRRVGRPINNEPSSREGSFIWDGTDGEGNRLPVGIYVIRIESYGGEGTGVAVAQKNVIVARRL
ncbi:MAG: lamin tail domain-containing protein [Candidatus Kapaibacterium sp.]